MSRTSVWPLQPSVPPLPLRLRPRAQQSPLRARYRQKRPLQPVVELKTGRGSSRAPYRAVDLVAEILPRRRQQGHRSHTRHISWHGAPFVRRQGVHVRNARTGRLKPVAGPASPILSPSQLATLAQHGEERTAAVGDVLFRVGDRRYPFIAIIEGEAAILDAAGNEIVRHGASGFLGEMNLLSGQTVFLTAVVTQALRYIAVDREGLRPLLFEDGPLSDLLLSTFMARREARQRVQGVGLEVIGPRSSDATTRMVEFARSNRLPYTWRDSEQADDPAAAALVAGLGAESLPLVRLPGDQELRGPSTGQVSRALGIGLELAPREEVDLVVIGAGPAGLGAAVYGASEGLQTLGVESTALGGEGGSSRRIENYLGFPAGISGSELTSRAVTQARKFEARTATPSRALSLEPGAERHVVRLEEDHEIAARAVLLATGAQYRRLPVDGLSDYEGVSVFYAAGPPEAQRCGATPVGVIGGGT